MFGKKVEFVKLTSCLRSNDLKQARKEGLGGEVMAFVW